MRGTSLSSFRTVTRPAFSNPPDPPVPPDPPPPVTDLKPTAETLSPLPLVLTKTSRPLPPSPPDLT
ncbi:unnamed protein product [Arabis nemorensis]|uniref:Uncharacterized protein n=1 Tax=Arabis nemorensis TaxID=586526 RepID=A0A565CLB2_9BRAS|nr:unnamed protein product [Arabis nemorensis]